MQCTAICRRTGKRCMLYSPNGTPTTEEPALCMAHAKYQRETAEAEGRICQYRNITGKQCGAACAKAKGDQTRCMAHTRRLGHEPCAEPGCTRWKRCGTLSAYCLEHGRKHHVYKKVVVRRVIDPVKERDALLAMVRQLELQIKAADGEMEARRADAIGEEEKEKLCAARIADEY